MKHARRRKQNGNFDRDLGNRIKAMRVQREMAQEWLARALSVSQQQIMKYEKGETPLLARDVNVLAKALDSSPNELFGFDRPNTINSPFNARAFKRSLDFEALPPQVQAAFAAIAAAMNTKK